MGGRLRRALAAGLVAVSTAFGLGVAAAPGASAELFQPRQQWLREATNGLFLHWGMRTAPGYTDCREWERAVTEGGWSADYWIGEALKLHAQYVVLASFHSRLGYARAWPSEVPGTCATQRDFLGELIDAGKARGVKTILYMTDDPQWYWEGLRPRPTDPNDALDTTKPSWMDSAAYSAWKGREVNLQLRPGFGEYSYDLFVEVMRRYDDLAGFWIDNDNAYWEQNGLYELIRQQRPTWTLSNNNEDTPIMDMVSHEQKVGMTPAYDYPQAVLTPMPRLTEGEWKLPTSGAWWFDGTDAPVDYPVTLGRIISNAGSSVKSLMAETAMVDGRFPARQEEFNNFARDYLAPIWDSIHGVEGGGYAYGGLAPGFWNDGAHGVTTVSRRDPDLHYVHVLTRPATATSITLRDNGYRVTGVRDTRTGAPMRFSQANGSLTIEGVTAWDTYDTVFTVRTAGRVGRYPQDSVHATASAQRAGFPAGNLVDGDYLSYWDSDTTLPVSIDLTLSRPGKVAYLAINQREWSPTYNRTSFNRPEDSARIKDYRLEASTDGTTWTTIKAGVLPSARAVQYLDLAGTDSVRQLRLTVDSTWAAADAPNYHRKLRIDEMWLGFRHADRPGLGPSIPYEAEHGFRHGDARIVACQECSGGRKVAGLGGPGNRVTVPVLTLTGGDRLLTLVGATEGTKSFLVRVNGKPVTRTPLTGWSASAPLLGASVTVKLHAGINLITVYNDEAAAPDLDKVILGPP
ncbi:MAG TPA: alpha-L-fucosidase [Actinophytocola sp.]|uniref:alpha-L-fucosidase n=1 Tax=Actinophytocola sp. TaxID=1872138 RepID=UPI002DDC9983|nr:alpha-L-fucosidase [Actinophytocola sp.]HEV2781810.1 alpha-L-fucosidase [Actinophytocola sp.]